MGLLSTHEAVVWWAYQHGKPTGDIFSEYENGKNTPAYVLDIFVEEVLQKEKKHEKQEAEIEKLKTTQFKSAAYVSRVLSRAKEKIRKELETHANSHRLDVETILDEKGFLRGFDYQANTVVYIVYTLKFGTVVWYKHDSYAGKLCDGALQNPMAQSDGQPCPKNEECRETLDTILEEYDLELRPDESQLYMTEQSIEIMTKLASKEVPRYKRT